MIYTFYIHADDAEGYWVDIPLLPEYRARGTSYVALKRHAVQAIHAHLDVLLAHEKLGEDPYRLIVCEDMGFPTPSRRADLEAQLMYIAFDEPGTLHNWGDLSCFLNGGSEPEGTEGYVDEWVADKTPDQLAMVLEIIMGGPEMPGFQPKDEEVETWTEGMKAVLAGWYRHDPVQVLLAVAPHIRHPRLRPCVLGALADVTYLTPAEDISAWCDLLAPIVADVQELALVEIDNLCEALLGFEGRAPVAGPLIDRLLAAYPTAVGRTGFLDHQKQLRFG